MKIKYALGILVSVWFVMTSSCLVFSAEVSKDTFEVGLPIDLNTGEKVTSVTKDQLLAFPIDVKCAGENYTAFSFTGEFDPEILKAGLSQAEIMGASAFNSLNALPMINSNPSGPADTYYGMSTILTAGGFYGPTPFGNTTTNLPETNHVFYSWYTSGASITDERNPEFYLIFKALKDVNIDEESLNYILVKHAAGFIEDTNDPVVNTDKYNACAGAFKVTIDGSKVPADTWIRNVYAQQSGQKAQEIKAISGTGDSGTYVFPVRVQLAEGATSTAANTVTFDIMADITATKDAEPTGQPQKIGSVNVSLDGTATDYADNSMYN